MLEFGGSRAVRDLRAHWGVELLQLVVQHPHPRIADLLDFASNRHMAARECKRPTRLRP